MVKNPPTEDFICNFCNYSICSLVEYLNANPKQRHQWTKNWYAHKKTDKHIKNSKYYEVKIQCLLENDSIYELSKNKMIDKLNSLLPKINEVLMTSLNCSIMAGRDSLLLFLYSFDSSIYKQFDKDGSNENEDFINFLNKMKLFKQIIENQLQGKNYQLVYETIGIKLIDIKIVS